jgi:hypothetical protein
VPSLLTLISGPWVVLLSDSRSLLVDDSCSGSSKSVELVRIVVSSVNVVVSSVGS